MPKTPSPKHSERRLPMSNLVTFDQAVNLCKLGFNNPCWRTYIITSKNLIPKGKDGRMNKNSELCKGYYSAPTVSEALDWIREEKGIVCYVDVIYHPIEKKAMYLGKILSESGIIIQKKTSDFDTHPLASSALLTAVLNYLIEKEK